MFKTFSVQTLLMAILLWMFKLSFTSSTASDISTSLPTCSNGALSVVSGLDDMTYSSLGDVNIGVFQWMTIDNGPLSCGEETMPGSFLIEYSEAIAFAAKSINENPNILPNVTLGFIQMDECGNSNVALAKSLSFLNRIGRNENCTCSTCSNVTNQKDRCNALEMPYYDVIGVISPMTSGSTSVVSKLFISSQLPLVGAVSTSDELSDKNQHPYFVRVTAPDKYQTKAMLKFIQSNGWSYISVLYEQGKYGEDAFENIKLFAPDYEICLAISHRVDDRTDFNDIVTDLLHFFRARVVILFVYKHHVRLLLKAVRNANMTGHFVWVGSDAWSEGFRSEFQGYENEVAGSFSFAYLSNLVPEFYRYLQDIEVNSTKNPWFKYNWERLAGCSVDYYEDCDPNYDMLSSDNFTFEKRSALYMDCVLSLAYAAHNLLSDRCPLAQGGEARHCISGDILLQYLRNVSFHGYNGHIEFNEFGDVAGLYEINQVVFDYKDVNFFNINSTIGLEAKLVAVYNVESDRINYTGRPLTWDYFLREGKLTSNSNLPVSVCSDPCQAGEFMIPRELVCCWRCQKCRDNEKLSNGNMSCEPCPNLNWPDPHTDFTTCKNIKYSYPSLGDPLPLLQIVLGLAALICTCVIVTGYLYYRNTRVIKATSRELSVLQLMALFVGYITVVLFQAPPTHTTCNALYLLFCLSFAWLYSPLLVKTVRIYRIFQSGVKNNRRPRFVSPQSQLVICSILVLIQVCLCLYVFIAHRPTARATQPLTTEPFVELACDMTGSGLVTFLTYNLLVVSLCSILAFKTRKLPDNFNESKFISMCVTTTLVIWLAFVPTYFTTERSSTRVLLLSLALLLNHTVALTFLFVPKIYAAAYMEVDESLSRPAMTAGVLVGTSKTGLTNRVSPQPGTSSATT